MKTLTILLSAIAVTGCTTVAPVIEEAIQCKPPEALLANCDTPQEIQAGVTYADLIKLMQQDRQNLADCGVRHEDLTKAIAVCNDEIDKYNQRIRTINAAVKR